MPSRYGGPPTFRPAKSRSSRTEQSRSEDRRATIKDSSRHAVQHDGRAEHEAQRQQASAGEAGHCVRIRAERRVDSRRPGEVGGEGGNRRAVKPVRPFQVPGREVERLVGERGIRPHQSQRERDLDGKDDRQGPPGAVERGRAPHARTGFRGGPGERGLSGGGRAGKIHGWAGQAAAHAQAGLRSSWESGSASRPPRDGMPVCCCQSPTFDNATADND
jgi:hypothetical protein